MTPLVIISHDVWGGWVCCGSFQSDFLVQPPTTVDVTLWLSGGCDNISIIHYSEDFNNVVCNFHFGLLVTNLDLFWTSLSQKVPN